MSNRRILELFEEQKDFMDEKIKCGIELYRKGLADIIIEDGDGNPVPDARIEVKQKSHEFRFGANLFMLDELESKEKNEKYKQYFKEVFNMATLPFYWDSTEPEKGKTRYSKDSDKFYRRPPIDLCMEWCEENGIEPREHGLAYERFFPEWLWDKSIFEIKSAFVNRCREISERYADRIPTIEVVNEMFWNENKARTAFYTEPDFVEWCFKTAEKFFPANKLAINDGGEYIFRDQTNSANKYLTLIENNLRKNVRIDAIGAQFHMFCRRENYYEDTRRLYNPKQLYRGMDLISELGKPIQITEITIPAYSDRTEDEEEQAKIIENLYSIWFSHPNVEQIIYWNLVDGYAAFAPQGDMTSGENYYYGGLLRFDLTPKPAYFAIKNLIEKKWHTEKELKTDENGKASFKGFYGEYDIEIKIGERVIKKKINLYSKGKNHFSIRI